MKVKIADLGISDPDVLDEVRTVLESGRYIGGPLLEEFAWKWAEMCGAEFCVPTASGSAALTSIMKAVLSPGNLVLLPALSFAASVFSVIETGCKPMYVDVTPNGLMDLDMVIRLSDEMSRPFAIMPVHLYGQYLELGDEILNCGGIIIEDACQAHGVFELQGHAAAFSFYPSKNLGAAGDAGAIVTNAKSVRDYVGTYINYGDPPNRKYAHIMLGTNARMDAIQAAVLLVKLGHFYEDQVRREDVARGYERGGIKSIATTRPTSWHQFPVLIDKRDEFVEAMREVGIEVGIHYPYVLPDIVDGSHTSIDNARLIANHVVALPIGPHMRRDDTEYVIEQFHDLVEFGELDGKELWRLKNAH